MKKRLLLALVAAGLAASAAAAAAPTVPLRSQQAIERRTRLYAYFPARVPLGFRYYRWSFTAGSHPALRIWFRNRARWEIVFVASPAGRACGRGEKTFQLDGNKVFWSHTRNEQQAWRCVRGRDGRLVRLTAATPLPPTRFSDSGLGRVAAAGRRI